MVSLESQEKNASSREARACRAGARGEKTFLTGFVFSPKTVTGRARTFSALW
jgi:hypothetical protein